MTPRAILSVAVLSALLWSAGSLTGCSSSEPPPSPQTIPQLDQGKKTAVETSLKQDGELAGEVIRVTARGNTVTLEGSVRTPEEKQRAEKIAASVKGVDKVENKLDVRPSTQ